MQTCSDAVLLRSRLHNVNCTTFCAFHNNSASVPPSDNTICFGILSRISHRFSWALLINSLTCILTYIGAFVHQFPVLTSIHFPLSCCTNDLYFTVQIDARSLLLTLWQSKVIPAGPKGNFISMQARHKVFLRRTLGTHPT
jgi:hypothetical protein